MGLPMIQEAPPLRTDEHGVVRVGDTRVTLDLVVGVFLDGATAEEIALRFDVLELGDVYATIAYYLHHRPEVDAYLDREKSVREEMHERFAKVVDVSSLRDRLLARHKG